MKCGVPTSAHIQQVLALEAEGAEVQDGTHVLQDEQIAVHSQLRQAGRHRGVACSMGWAMHLGSRVSPAGAYR